jgi:quinol monooxygenase YgiN
MNDAIRNAAGADLKGATTVLDPEARHVTIINTYVVESERADELFEFLVEATRSTIRHLPGFLSANLHVAIDRTLVMNYAQWQSREAIAAARENRQVVTLMQAQLRIAKSFAPALYDLRACFSGASCTRLLLTPRRDGG